MPPRPARPERPAFGLDLVGGNKSNPGQMNAHGGTNPIPGGGNINHGGGGLHSPSGSTEKSRDESVHWSHTKEVLGEGALAKVELVILDEVFSEKYFQAKHKKLPAALKTSKVNSAFSAPLKEKIKREKEYANRKCTHPNLVKYLKVFDQKAPVKILMEFMDLSSLTSAIAKFEAGKISPEDRVELCRSIGIQVLLGLQYLHTAEGIMHRDVKQCNVLLSTEGRVKVCDFDTARKVGNSNIGSSSGGVAGGIQADTVTGTMGFMAPEVVKSTVYDGQCDVWSVGAMLYQLATDSVPYVVSKCKKDQPFSSIIDFDRTGAVDLDLKDFLLKVLVDDPKVRLTVAQAISHPFFASVYQPDVELAPVLKKEGLSELHRLSVRAGVVSAEDELKDLHNKLEEYRQRNISGSANTSTTHQPGGGNDQQQPPSANARSAPAAGAAHNNGGTPPAVPMQGIPPASPTPSIGLGQTPPVAGQSSSANNSLASPPPSLNTPNDNNYNSQSPRSTGSPTNPSLRNNTTGDMNADVNDELLNRYNSTSTLQSGSSNNSLAGGSSSSPMTPSKIWSSEEKNGALFMMKRVIYKRQEKAVQLLFSLIRKYGLRGIDVQHHQQLRQQQPPASPKGCGGGEANPASRSIRQ